MRTKSDGHEEVLVKAPSDNEHGKIAENMIKEENPVNNFVKDVNSDMTDVTRVDKLANDESHQVRRGVPRVSGIYVKGHVETVDIVYTVDTGASATLVSSRVFDEIPVEQKPQLDCEKLPKFMGPSGDAIHILGRATLKLSIGKMEISKSVTIADIHDDCLLGADILLGLEEGPFDFHLSENRLKWNGIFIPCIQVRYPTSCKVLCATDCTISAYSEQVVVGPGQTEQST